MADLVLHCSIITPEGPVFEAAVESVVIPAHDGQLGILRNHAPLVCKLGAGRLQARTAEVEERWFVDGGFCQVFENQVTVLTPRTIRPEEINRAAAEAQLAEASKMVAKDEVSLRHKAEAEASARAQLRMLP
ncbi:MAG: ATP synthase F1 subunit epsilon [Phycisphaerae bacterium]|nr:ATP synthase F1 subunit epsilon [Phycisphaerae bacterium]